MDVIDAQTVERLSPMPELIDAIEAQLKSESVSPPRQAHELTKDASLLIMPAWQKGGVIGVKLTHVDTQRRPGVAATYILMDQGSGQPLAILDGATLTARRTAAASALAARTLARKNSASLLIVGTGTLCPLVAEAYASIRDLNQITLWGRAREKADCAAAAIRSFFPQVQIAESLEDATLAADIVSCVTSATHPLVSAHMIKAGTHIDLIGAFRPDMTEADPSIFAAATVFVDTREGAVSEAGDLIQALAAGALTEEDIVADLAGLSSGYARSEDEITVFKSVGMALEDLAAAMLVYRRFAEDRGHAA
ncbi:MAG: ornithine cyclodeaminase family protein [Pseudomonadota bacterium]